MACSIILNKLIDVRSRHEEEILLPQCAVIRVLPNRHLLGHNGRLDIGRTIC